MEQPENLPKPEDDPDHIGFRDGNLFIVDLIPEMFTAPPNTEETHFEQFLQAYGRILSQKLSWNRSDWMGLVFFGTKEWNMEPETKHILTVQKFGEIKTNMLEEVMKILNHKMDFYKKMCICSEYPLHDVLWHAAMCFQSVKVAMTRRRVILVTCRDNPFEDDEAERHRIRLKAESFNGINVNLRILGMATDWNHELFYKDIEMLANNIEKEDVKRMLLQDLEVQVKFEARVTAHLPLRIGEGLRIRTVISPFSGAAKYLKQVRMSKETNEILDVYRHFGQPESFEDASDEESQELLVTMAPDDTRKAISCGDKLISFTQKEIRKMRMPGNPGIDLLGFKEISYDLRYHISATNFLGLEHSASDQEKELFTALLYECEARNVMGISVVYGRGGPYLAKMIPCTRYGGFYLYKIAFFEQVNNLDEYLREYIDGGQEESELVDEAGLALMKKLVKKLLFNWDPWMFHNPKVEAQLAYIETLALDTEAQPLEDTTLPSAEVMEKRLGRIATEFTEIFGSQLDSSPKRPSSTSTTRSLVEKHAKFDDDTIQELIETGQLKNYTIPVLKAMARSLGAKTTGTKAELIERVTMNFTAKNTN